MNIEELANSPLVLNFTENNARTLLPLRSKIAYPVVIVSAQALQKAVSEKFKQVGVAQVKDTFYFKIDYPLFGKKQLRINMLLSADCTFTTSHALVDQHNFKLINLFLSVPSTGKVYDVNIQDKDIELVDYINEQHPDLDLLSYVDLKSLHDALIIQLKCIHYLSGYTL